MSAADREKDLAELAKRIRDVFDADKPVDHLAAAMYYRALDLAEPNSVLMFAAIDARNGRLAEGRHEQPEPAPIYDHLVGQRGDPDAVFAGVDLVSMPQFTYSCDTEGATA